MGDGQLRLGQRCSLPVFLCLAPEAWPLSRLLLHSGLWSWHGAPLKTGRGSTPVAVSTLDSTANGPCPTQTQKAQLPAQSSLLERKNHIERSFLNKAEAPGLIILLPVVQILPSGTVQGKPSPFPRSRHSNRALIILPIFPRSSVSQITDT